MLRETIEDELDKRKFMFVKPGMFPYFEKKVMFDDDVRSAFPSAVSDMCDARISYAVGLHTACVFHSMRIAERGMRVLAWDRRVKFEKKPIELQDWEGIIKGVNNEIDKIVQWSGRCGLAKTQAQEFYNGSLLEFRAFRDAWRNHVMHTRRNYNANDAKGVMDHVSRFMKTLSKRISEASRTPRVWTQAQVIRIP